MIVFVALQHGSALRRIDASAGPFSLHISLCSLQYFNVGSNNNIKKTSTFRSIAAAQRKLVFASDTREPI